ncbi:MAG TPA: GrpB family protein [Bradyrhizobium sp.]|jgi:hypothetical protein|nr:GrpB family protein [Bradyrhizobium sp.]
MADADIFDLIGCKFELPQKIDQAQLRRDVGRRHRVTGVPQHVFVAMLDEIAAEDKLQLQVAISTSLPGLTRQSIPLRPRHSGMRPLGRRPGRVSFFCRRPSNLDYVHLADNPKQDRMFFVKGMPPFGSRRTHHVHVTENHGEMWQRLTFRDYLRAHPEQARTYEQLKRRLATKHQTDREAYTDAKSAYIESVMRKAIK